MQAMVLYCVVSLPAFILSVGREPSEFTPVDRALAAEPERGLRVITG